MRRAGTSPEKRCRSLAREAAARRSSATKTGGTGACWLGAAPRLALGVGVGVGRAGTANLHITGASTRAGVGAAARAEDGVVRRRGTAAELDGRREALLRHRSGVHEQTACRCSRSSALALGRQQWAEEEMQDLVARRRDRGSHRGPSAQDARRAIGAELELVGVVPREHLEKGYSSTPRPWIYSQLEHRRFENAGPSDQISEPGDASLLLAQAQSRSSWHSQRLRALDHPPEFSSLAHCESVDAHVSDAV